MSKPAPISARVERIIDASPEVIYNLVADLPRMAEWSPEAVEVTWLDETAEANVGSRFKGRNELGKTKWSVKGEVTVAEPGRVFAFKVNGKSGPEWRYELQPTEGGTLVIESVEQQKRSPLPVRLLQRKEGVTDRTANIREGMATTLQNLAASAASVDA